MNKRAFHITVGSIGSMHIADAGDSVAYSDLERDVLLTKMALLYGDKVTVCSCSTSLTLKGLSLQAADIFEQLEFFQKLTDNPVVIRNIEIYKELLRKKRPTPRERAAIKRMESLNIKQQIHQKSTDPTRLKQIEDLGLDGLNDAVREGLLNFKMISYSERPRKMLEDLITLLSDAAANRETYPLFDDTAGRIVYSALREGMIYTGEHRRGKHINLAACLLERLPRFDKAKISDLLGIREELKAPLVRFRGAIGSFAQEIQRAPWDSSFQQDADLVFHERVMPAVSEIEEEVRSSRFTKLFGKKLVANAWPLGLAPLSAVVSQHADLDELITFTISLLGACSVGALAKSGSEAYNESMARQSEIKKNQMFFYYQAGKTIQEVR